MTPSNEGMVGVLSDDEVLALGLSSIVSDGQVDGGDMGFDHIGGGMPENDGDGRRVVSWEAFGAIQRSGQRVDGLALRVIRPGVMSVRGKTWLIQASKYLKWYGYGYCHPNDLQGMATLTGKPIQKVVSTPKRSVAQTETDSDFTVYRCADKYADCTRFFDLKKGLEAHWRLEHGVNAVKRRRSSATADPSAVAMLDTDGE